MFLLRGSCLCVCRRAHVPSATCRLSRTRPSLPCARTRSDLRAAATSTICGTRAAWHNPKRRVVHLASEPHARLPLAAQLLVQAVAWLRCTAPWKRRFGRHVAGRCAERAPRSRCFPPPQVHQLERTTQTVTDVSAPLVSERMCVGRSLFRSCVPPDAGASLNCAATPLLSGFQIFAQRLRSVK